MDALMQQPPVSPATGAHRAHYPQRPPLTRQLPPKGTRSKGILLPHAYPLPTPRRRPRGPGPFAASRYGLFMVAGDEGDRHAR